MGSKYCFTYLIGNVITALDNTPGIYCFKTEKQAMAFKSSLEKETIIIKVKALGQEISSHDIGHYYYTSYHDKVKKFEDDTVYVLLDGTICFKSIKVLT